MMQRLETKVEPTKPAAPAEGTVVDVRARSQPHAAGATRRLCTIACATSLGKMIARSFCLNC